MVTKIATDITTLERDMMLWMLGCIAELERDTIRERTILGKKRKAEKASAWKISKK